jgi:hypothetical protein
MYIWYCSLGHIGVKHTKKVHSNGLLKSLDFKSSDICEPYLMGKMTNTPFSNVMNSLQILQIRAMPYVKMTSRRLYRLLWGRRGVTLIVLVYSEFGGGVVLKQTLICFFFASGQQAVKPADILPKSFWTRWSAKKISENTNNPSDITSKKQMTESFNLIFKRTHKIFRPLSPSHVILSEGGRHSVHEITRPLRSTRG